MLWKQKTVITQAVEDMPEPMAEKPLDKWNAKLAGYKKLAERITVSQGKAEIPDDVAKAFKALADLDKDQNNFKLFIGAQIDLDKALPLAQSGVLPWWLLHTGHAFTGDLEGLRRVDDEMKKAGQKPTYDAAFTWVSHTNDLVEGFSSKITVGVLQQLVDWGANPNYDGGKWLEMGMRGGLNAKGLEPVLKGGADAAHVMRVLEDLGTGSPKQAKIVLEALRGLTLNGKVDDQTLLQATFSPDGAVLKTYFNFASRRVQEVHVQVGKDSAMDAGPFRDYDGGAIEAAQKALEKLGGKPVPYVRPGSLGFG